MKILASFIAGSAITALIVYFAQRKAVTRNLNIPKGADNAPIFGTVTGLDGSVRALYSDGTKTHATFGGGILGPIGHASIASSELAAKIGFGPESIKLIRSIEARSLPVSGDGHRDDALRHTPRQQG